MLLSYSIYLLIFNGFMLSALFLLDNSMNLILVSALPGLILLPLIIRDQIVNRHKIVSYIIIIIFINLFIFNSILHEKFFSIINVIQFYIIPLLIYPIFINLSEYKPERAFKALTVSTVIITLWGFLQFVGRDVIPWQLLSIPNTYGLAAFNRVVLGDVTVIRPNFSLGSSMVCAYFFNIMYLFMKFRHRSSAWWFLGELMFVLTLFLTFSRVGIVLHIFNFFTTQLLLRRYKSTLFISSISLFIMFYYLNDYLFYTLGRFSTLLTGQDRSLMAHSEDYIAALNMLSEFPLGIPVGLAGAIITDGAIFHILLETSILGLLFIIYPCICVFRFYHNTTVTDKAVFVLLCANISLHSVLNSGLLTNFNIIVSMLLVLSVARYGISIWQR